MGIVSSCQSPTFRKLHLELLLGSEVMWHYLLKEDSASKEKGRKFSSCTENNSSPNSLERNIPYTSDKWFWSNLGMVNGEDWGTIHRADLFHLGKSIAAEWK